MDGSYRIPNYEKNAIKSFHTESENKAKRNMKAKESILKAFPIELFTD